MWYESLETVGRTLLTGCLGYLGIILILRLSGKRTLAKWNAFDFIVTVALGSVFATMIVSKSTTLTQGLVAFALLILLQFIVTSISVRSATFRRQIKADPELLLCRGQLLDEVLKRNRVAPSEVRAAARSNGFASLEDVDAVVLETDGEFSVIGSVDSSFDQASALEDVVGASRLFSRKEREKSEKG